MLTLKDVDAKYGQLQVLRSVSLNVSQGEIVSLLGANGAGKTSILKSITGGVNVTSGSVTFCGVDITGKRTDKVVKLGVAHVPENRRVFKNLKVEDNLMLGGFNFDTDKKMKERLAYVYELFPRLLERKEQIANTLSGGEQQMLAIGRALMMKPKLLIMDEPSQGLAPQIVELIFNALRTLQKQGNTILLVEQNIKQALKISDWGYIIKNGKIIMKGSSQDLLQLEDISNLYL